MVNARIKSLTDLDRPFLHHSARSLRWPPQIQVNSLNRSLLRLNPIPKSQWNRWLSSKKALLIRLTISVQTSHVSSKWLRCSLLITIRLWVVVSSSFHITTRWMWREGHLCKSSTRLIQTSVVHSSPKSTSLSINRQRLLVKMYVNWDNKTLCSILHRKCTRASARMMFLPHKYSPV